MEKWSFQRIRELMTRIALRGMAGNELGRARISMMVRSMSSNTRPDTLVQDQGLQPHDFSCNARRVHTLGSKPEVSRTFPVGLVMFNEQTPQFLAIPCLTVRQPKA